MLCLCLIFVFVNFGCCYERKGSEARGSEGMKNPNFNLTHLKCNNNNAVELTHALHSIKLNEHRTKRNLALTETNKYNLIVLIIGSVSAKITIFFFFLIYVLVFVSLLQLIAFDDNLADDGEMFLF